jgi:hypothetical protein
MSTEPSHSVQKGPIRLRSSVNRTEVDSVRVTASLVILSYLGSITKNGKKRFLGHSIRCMSYVNVVRKRAGTILSDGINKYFLSLLPGFMASVRELNCHTV